MTIESGGGVGVGGRVRCRSPQFLLKVDRTVGDGAGDRKFGDEVGIER